MRSGRELGVTETRCLDYPDGGLAEIDNRVLVRLASQPGTVGLSRETTSLGYAADFINLDWFPAGPYLIEQSEAATVMYLLLSG